MAAVLTFRVTLTNPAGWRLTVIAPGVCDSDACRRAEADANVDPEHAKHGPWVAGFSTRNS